MDDRSRPVHHTGPDPDRRIDCVSDPLLGAPALEYWGMVMGKEKPFWMPDTQGFLAIAIVSLIGLCLVLLLTKPNMVIDDKVTSLLQVMLGILLGSFKDVYSFFFGSSKGSEKKDDALISGQITPPVTPPPPVIPPTEPLPKP